LAKAQREEKQMQKSSIEWAKNPDGSPGYTWNPLTGCNNQIDGMCKGGNFPCYAWRLANTRLRGRYLANKNVAPFDSEEEYMLKRLDPFYPRFWEGGLTQVSPGQKPRGIFTCSMSDLFGVGIPYWWTQSVLWHINNCPQHRFYLLTKQPQNLNKFSPFPQNCYVGVTACNASDAIKANEYIAKIEAKTKYLSIEPMQDWNLFPQTIAGIMGYYNWVIIGGQTKPYRPPEISWVREIVEAADKAGIPIFLKENLAPIIDTSMDWAFNKIGYRQEMPSV